MRPHVGFGTVVGYHTVAELQDLVASYDAILRNVARRLGEVSDSPDKESFLTAYNTLTARYNAARAAAQVAIDDAVNAWRPADMIVAEEEWNNLLSAVNPRWKEYTWSPGDGSIQDLYSRVIDAGATGAYDEPIPQPRPGTDVDLNTLQATTQATQAIEGVGHRAASLFDTKHLIAYGLLGGAFVIFVLPRLMLLGMPGGMLLRR
jgi:hypothetical protein